jgi:SM-20-related protein
MPYLCCDTLGQTPLQRDPFDYVVVPDFIRGDQLAGIAADFPSVPGPGSHPPSELRIVGHFAGLLEELNGEKFRQVIESKFSIDLIGSPTMATVRGQLRMKDGSIHTDSKSKIITVLLYLNEHWDSDGGRLRLLRSGTDLEDYVVEVPPVGGALLAFRRSDNSWHGHKPYEGQRRGIQFNWVTNQDVVNREQARHRFSTRLKMLTGILSPAHM